MQKLTIPFEPEESFDSIDIVEYKNRLDSLTPSQRTIFKLIRSGLSCKQVASLAMISPKTVEKHSAAVRQKLQADSTTEMLSMYYRWLILWRESKCAST